MMDLWTRLWGRYHVPQNVFLVVFITHCTILSFVANKREREREYHWRHFRLSVARCGYENVLHTCINHTCCTANPYPHSCSNRQAVNNTACLLESSIRLALILYYRLPESRAASVMAYNVGFFRAQSLGPHHYFVCWPLLVRLLTPLLWQQSGTLLFVAVTPSALVCL